MKTLYHLTKQSLVWILMIIQPVISYANENKPINSGNVLSSTQLVAAVLQANPELEIAQATWQASITRIEQQSSLDDPQFQYSFAPLSIDSEKSDFGQRFEISQKIPFPGKLSVREKAAEYAAEASQYDIATLQLSLATKAKSLFAEWYFIHQAFDINNINLALLAEIRDIALTRYSTGQTSKKDVLHAEMEQTLLRHQAIILQQQRKTLLAQLNTLLNRPVDAPLPKPQKPAEINELPKFKYLQIKAMQSRPELKAIAAQMNVHKNQAELAKLSFYPDFKLSAGYNSLWDNEDKRFNIGVGVNIPLDQGKLRAAEQEVKANSQQAHWRNIDMLASINEELAIAYAQSEKSLQVLQLYRQQLSSLADATLVAAKTDYQAGKGDFLTLIDSEKKRMQTQLQTEQAFADVHRSFAQLEQAAGSLEPLSTAGHSGRNVP